MTSTFGKRPWFWEGHVQGALAAHLAAAEGWEVHDAADTEAKVPGIDLLATKAQRWLAIEVKGYPNTTYDHGTQKGETPAVCRSMDGSGVFTEHSNVRTADVNDQPRSDRSLPHEGASGIVSGIDGR